MKYLYYPGCSLEGTAAEYDVSVRSVMAALGVDLVEPPGWTCCGATAAEPLSRLLALALPARNLALAAQTAPDLDVLAPCSACYLNLKKAGEKIRTDPELNRDVKEILAVDDLTLDRHPKVRHLLDVLINDVGPGRVAEATRYPLAGLQVVPYYGCQCLRPYPVFDDPEAPRSMEPLIRAAGAEVFDWSLGARCCGAAHMNTKPEVGLELVADLLQAASGADVMVTVCPMCQINLEGFQARASRARQRDLSIPVLYLPQLLGVAFGLNQKDLRLDWNLAASDAFRRRYQSESRSARSDGG